MLDKLNDFDAYMDKILKDWNCPGVGMGIIANDELVYAKGYGYRDYGNELPVTASTLFPIGSDTKLFTAVAAGLLVDEGLLSFDHPIRDAVPELRFCNDALNNTVTLRDMLAHRTGISRHDMIWYRSEFTRQQLFDRIRFMQPSQAFRHGMLYNNLMYAAVGHIIELKTGKTWEAFVRERILEPLGMTNTVYAVQDMFKQADFGVPFTERRDSRELYKIPHYEQMSGVAPAGAIISNVQDISRWLVTLMNNGRLREEQVIPQSVLKATLEPAVAHPNLLAESRGFLELMNGTYGMGRGTSIYRGHLLTSHGGHIDGFTSHISYMPHHKFGVMVFVIGNHCDVLSNIVGYNVYERMLGLNQTPWSERWLDVWSKSKQANTEARGHAATERITGTRCSHDLADYAGDFEHPAYGVLNIGLQNDHLVFNFRRASLRLTHFHYDRFDTEDDQQYGKWSVNFGINPQGDIDRAVMSLDESEAVFMRRPEHVNAEALRSLVGVYEYSGGFKVNVVLKGESQLFLLVPGAPDGKLLPYKGLKFHMERFSDIVFEFEVDGGQITALKQRDPSGEYAFVRK